MENKGKNNSGNRINSNQNRNSNIPNNPNRNPADQDKRAKNKKRAKLIVMIIAVLILIFVACVVAIIMIVYNQVYEETSFIDRSEPYVMPDLPSDYLGNPNEVSISEEDIIPETGRQDAIYKVKPIDENVINILLVGKETTNSDSMIIASYNKKTGRIVLASCLRDSYVPIEGYGWRKLNATFPLGGVGLTINTINQIYDLDIQRYITVDFEGFVRLIDILGGVEIDLSELEASRLNEDYNLNLSPGLQTLNGQAALYYSRLRYRAGDDYKRTERQRKVITAALNKLYNTRNVNTVKNLIAEGIQYVKTNLKLSEIYSLLDDFMRLDRTNIESMQIPGSGMFTEEKHVKVGDYYVEALVVDFEKNKKYIREKLYGN